jgi:hypothetical protein
VLALRGQLLDTASEIVRIAAALMSHPQDITRLTDAHLARTRRVLTDALGEVELLELRALAEPTPPAA